MGIRITAKALPIILMTTLTVPWSVLSIGGFVFPSMKRRILNPAPPRKPLAS
ncbi:MAG: hypothetical protein AAB903_03160 [Patescibacteria group bacterium]